MRKKGKINTKNIDGVDNAHNATMSTTTMRHGHGHDIANHAVNK